VLQGGRRILVVELPSLHIVRGPGSRRGCRLALLKFEVAAFLAVLVELLASLLLVV
jgi:hypothetical protein